MYVSHVYNNWIHYTNPGDIDEELEVISCDDPYTRTDPPLVYIASSKYYTTNVSIYNLETGAKTDIGFPKADDSHSLIEYEGQEMYAINAWYEEGKVDIYAVNSADRTLVVFTLFHLEPRSSARSQSRIQFRSLSHSELLPLARYRYQYQW